MVSAGAVTAITAITPGAISLGAPFVVTATFATGVPRDGTTEIGFTLTPSCGSPFSQVPYGAADTEVFPPLLTAGLWGVCWFDGGAWSLQALPSVEVRVFEALPTSISEIAPDRGSEGLSVDLDLVGGRGSPTSELALSGPSAVVLLVA